MSLERMQQSLNEIYLYIELRGDKAKKLEEQIFSRLSQLGFYQSRRAEGYAFFVNEAAALRSLPNIRLSISGNILITRTHMVSGLREENTSAIGLSVEEVYDRIVKGVEEIARVYDKFKQWAEFLIINKP